MGEPVIWIGGISLSIVVLVAAMRKYQKIEQIMNQAQTPWGVIQDTWLYKEIREVLEDENDD